ncbi:MAG: DUF1104 domain-containing protein [Campylobacter sp.]|nr:DUF1104 domain-containing protein [Campylobacter sp.]
MKKILFTSIIVASTLFAANVNTEAIANADAKTLATLAFENKKKAGELEGEARKLRHEFSKAVKEKLSKLNAEDRAKFMREYKKTLDEKIDSLSVKEARRLGFIPPRVDYHNFTANKTKAHKFVENKGQK